MGSGKGPIQTILTFSEIPDQPLQIRLATLMTSVEGPWQVEWQPLPVSLEIMAQPSSTPAQTATILALAPTAPVHDPLAIEVEDLLQKGFTALYGQPGWVHIRSENTEPQNSGFVGPAHSTGEYWKYIDAEKFITQYALVVKDASGAIWQKIARVGKTQVNFTTGAAMEDEKLLHRVQVDNLPDAIEHAGQQGIQVVSEEAVVDGRDCLLVTLNHRYDPPVELTGMAKRVSKDEVKTWIERQTGWVLRKQTIQIFEDGTSVVSQDLQTTIQERVDAPPPEIQNLLNQVVIP
jgi:hypothetical protein